MGIPVLILGESGSGKSASMRNFSENEVGLFNVAAKPLPFPKQLTRLDNANYENIKKALSNPTKKTYVIDDSQYLMSFELFHRASETGYAKFTEMALHFHNLLEQIKHLPDDVIVYLLHHCETTETGKIKAKTIGKMLDNQLTVEGLFSIVLMARTDGQRYWFETHTDGFTTVKTPMGMFAEREIDNDLKAVDATIRAYYHLDKKE